MRPLLPFIAASLLLAGCDRPAPGTPAVEVEEAWVRLPAAPGRPAAAYFTLRAFHADIPLVAVTSSDAQSVELHDSRMENGVMTMQRLESAIVPAGGEIAFEPGGQHAMLFGVDPAIEPGGRVQLTLSFDGVDPIPVQAEARGPGGEPAHGGH